MALMELRYDKAALAPYEAGSDGYGPVADALQIILRLSVRRDDAMKSLGGSFSNLSIQVDPMLAKRCVSKQTSIADDGTEGIRGTPKKRGATSIVDDLAEDAPEPLLVFQWGGLLVARYIAFQIAPKLSQNDPRAIPNLSQNDPKTIPKPSKNDPRTIPNLSQSHPKTIPRRSQNDPKTIPCQKCAQNDPKTYPKTAPRPGPIGGMRFTPTLFSYVYICDYL